MGGSSLVFGGFLWQTSRQRTVGLSSRQKALAVLLKYASAHNYLISTKINRGYLELVQAASGGRGGAALAGQQGRALRALRALRARLAERRWRGWGGGCWQGRWPRWRPTSSSQPRSGPPPSMDPAVGRAGCRPARLRRQDATTPHPPTFPSARRALRALARPQGPARIRPLIPQAELGYPKSQF